MPWEVGGAGTGRFSRPGSAGRHTTFHQLREALEGEGCAVCRLALESVARSLDALIYEEINDPPLRRRLRAARGLCPRHAWQLVRGEASALGVAILYRDLLGEVAGLLEAGAGGAGRPSPVPGRAGEVARALPPREPCLACLGLADSADRYLGTLVDHLPEADFAAAYRGSPGLCLPHLDRALRRAPPAAARETLLATALRSLQEASDRADRPDPSAARALVERLVGARGALVGREPLPMPSGIREAAGETPGPGDLSAALRREGCPLCRRARDGAAAVLARLAAGQRSDPGDLCNLHAWRFLEPARLESAVAFLQGTARDAVERLEKPAPERPSGPRRWPSWLRRGGSREPAVPAPESPCPVEACTSHLEAGWARALANEVTSPEVREAFRASPGLCLPHLILTLSHAGPRGEPVLARLQAERLRDLASKLAEFVRKQDYRFRGEPWGREASSPRRAVESLVGPEGLRGTGGLWWPRG